ncbi:MAG: hypothetical protein AAF203_05630, partial [Pseudomonadota bacterium]
VKKEIEWSAHNKIVYLDCADSNFGIVDRDINFAKWIAKAKVQTGYPKMFNFTSAKNQPKNVENIQAILGKSGIDRGISISLQSFRDQTLQAIKRFNQPKGQLDLTIKDYKQRGLESFVELILGLPNESFQSWSEGIDSLTKKDYNGVILIHPLSIVPNTPFSNREYQERYGLLYTKTRSPAQGFNYGTESSQERETICYGSSSMTPDEWQNSYLYGKCLIGAQYYHGLSYYLAEFLWRQKALSPGQFFLKMLNEKLGDSSSIVGHDLSEAKKLLQESLFELRPWGRQVLAPEKFYWSDQAASAIFLLTHEREYFREMRTFITDLYPEIEEELIDDLISFNQSSLKKPFQKASYVKKFNFDWPSYFFHGKPLKKMTTEVEFVGPQWTSHRDHGLHTYWFGRKNRRCFMEIKGTRHYEQVSQPL